MASSPSSSSSLPSNVEQVWQDIKLASLSNTSIAPPEIAFHKDNISLSSHSACKSQQTLLTLTSMSLLHKQSHHSFLPSFNTSLSFDVLESSTIRPLHGEKKSQQHIYASSDQRHKRMIKNRESALRSRARKQAYKKGLEMKIARLTEENSRLRRQVEELWLWLASSAKPPPSKRGALYRSTSSPF